ncbi:hypothetical protein ACN9MH_06140 [Paenibacillus silvae]|uniref:hypothetical protein n=1 Tax=Paenibacillus TaxID=44249 RepID=UPI001C10A3BF|nr:MULTISPECIES: hypothetical protein [Paenibacillus]MBU5353575.1 hypothetical protein [Paenibacillus barcinonensis]MDM5279455.1 hypothetical protein [Paenibacillus silvae]
MFSQPIFVASILLLLLAAGELVSVWSRARIPSLLIILVGFLLLSWAGFFPEGIVKTSALTAFGSLMVAPLLVHMGTLIPIKLIRSQYKAILISLIATITGTVLILLIVSPIYGYTVAVSGASPVVGGILSYLITTQKLQELNLAYLITIPAVIMAIHSLFGMPIATNLLRRYVVKMKGQGFFENKSSVGSADPHAVNTSKALLPSRFQTPPILLFLLFLAGSLAVLLNSLTSINYSIWALLLGILGHMAGIFPARIMDKAGTTGAAMVGLIVVVMSSTDGVTYDALVQSLGPVLLIIVIAAVGIIVGGFAASKLLKWDPLKGIPVALTAMFGFPGDYIICEEVSRSVTEDEQERKVIMDEILTPMLVGGFTTVTTASIVVASILVNTL